MYDHPVLVFDTILAGYLIKMAVQHKIRTNTHTFVMLYGCDRMVAGVYMPIQWQD